MACDDAAAMASDAGAIPKTFFAAVAHTWAGDAQAARPLYAQARSTLEQRLHGRSDQPGTRVTLAYTLLALGEREAAFAQTQQALDELPLSLDAVSAPFVMTLAAGFYAVAGDHDRAFELLERTLSLPAGEHAAAARVNPVYDVLRDDPRFDALMTRYGV
jgi:tetratricopeptide (TPR) repeat protein